MIKLDISRSDYIISNQYRYCRNIISEETNQTSICNYYQASVTWPEVIKEISCSTQLRMKMFLLINANKSLHFNIYKQEK